MAERLTLPMVEPLTDIAAKPLTYITPWSRWDQTAQALIRGGLANTERARQWQIDQVTSYDIGRGRHA